MTLKLPDPWITLPVDMPCSTCHRTIPAGEPVRPTTGLMRHNGKYVGKCCDT